MKNPSYLTTLVFTVLLGFTANAQWTGLTIPNSTVSMRCAYFKNTNEGFVAGGERIRHTANGGTTWDTTSYGIYGPYLTGCTVEGIHFVNANEGVAIGWNFWDNCEIVFKTYDGGITWASIKYQGAFDTYLHDMTFLNSTVGICAGDFGHILATSNAGETWSYQTSGVTNNLYGVYFTGSTGWIVGDEIILNTTNSGSTWSSQAFTGEYFRDVYFTSSSVGYAVGNHIYKTTNGGANWSQVSTSLALSCNDVWAVDNDTLFIANDGNLLKSNDAGVTWFQQPTSTNGKNYLGVWFMNSTFGIATTSDGMVYKTTTGGDAVQQNDAGVTAIQPLPFGSCKGVYPVQVQIKNYGQANLTQTQIGWKVNGVVQPPFVWTGNLSQGSVTVPISIGSYNFVYGNYDIVAYTMQANTQSDYIHYNDTASTIFSLQRLGGSYTVGGTNPDYATLDDAIDALNNYGTCGSVEFKLRNGTYQPVSSPFEISDFYRTNASDSVVFKSETGDSSQVIIQGFSSILVIDKSDNVSFLQVSFSIINSGNAVDLSDSTVNIQFLNCVFNMPASSTSILHSGNGLVNLRVDQCKFFGGDFGIKLLSFTGGTMDGIKITHCSMDSISELGVDIEYAKNILIQDNTITGFRKYFLAMSLTDCSEGFVINRNKLMVDKGSALSLDNCNFIPGMEGIVSNSFFSVNNNISTLTSCIGISNSSNLKIVHNTINCNNDQAFRIFNQDSSYFPMITFQNNVVCNRRNNVIFDLVMTAGIPDYGVFKMIDHNAYYNLPGGATYHPYRFFVSGDFEAWKGIYPSDSTSVFANPQFTSIYDYHILPNTSNIRLNNAGKYIAGYIVDFDNITRSLMPDIGCAEFSLEAVDAGVKSFLVQSRICSGINPVELRIGNFGLNNITSGTISWKVNNVAQTPFAWSGNISSGDSSGLVSIGTYNFVNGTSYTIQAWMSNANGNADVNHINDTVSVTVTAKGLSGIYTIGGTNPDYVTFSAATAGLISNGVCGPVTFNVRNGVYQDSIAIIPVAGSSLLNNITFQSETGDSTAVMLWNTNKRVIRIDTAAYLNFNNMTIVDSSTAVMGCVYFRGGPHHVAVRNCILRSWPSSAVILNDGNVVRDITVDRNRFSKGGGAVNFWYNMTGFYLNDRITISNNQMTGLSYDNISIEHGNNIFIHNNFIHSYLYYTPPGLNRGIFLQCGDNSKITVTNNIIDLRNFSAGIQHSGTGLPSDKNLIANNMVSMLGPETDNAFSLQASTNTRIVYNSGLVDSATYQYCSVLYGPGLESEIYNNSFYNSGTGYAIYFYNTNCISDYNNFFNDSLHCVKTYFNHYSVSNWQQFSGSDMHSVSGNPQYISQSNLHSAGSYYLNALATPLTDIGTDIDGNTRTTAPDMGADQFALTLQPNDAGVYDVENPDTLCPGNYAVRARIKNFGSAILSSATINWKVNGVLQTPFSWNGSLPSLGISGYLNIGNYAFTPLDTFSIISWTTTPNGNADMVAANDTSILDNILTRMQGIYTIGGTSPDFTTLTDAIRTVNKTGICGPVTFNIRNGTYSGPNTLIGPVVGTSPANPITLQSESGDSSAVIINYNTNNGNSTLSINDVDYLIIKQLTVNGAVQKNAIRLYNGSEYCKIQNCVLNQQMRVEINCHHNLIENNLCHERILLSALTANENFGNTVRYNNVVFDYGILCQFQDSLLVEGNTITNPNSFSTSSNYGIHLLADETHFKCIKNQVTGNFSDGIYLDQSGNPGDTGIVANNIVTAGTQNEKGVHLNGEYVKVVYNTFYYPAGSGGFASYNASAGFDHGLIVLNNQFVNYANGLTAYWGSINGSTHTISDYNNFYSTGTDLINVAVSVNYPTIAAFNAAYPSYEPHSTGFDPQFISPQLLFPTNVATIGTGIPITGVNDDFNGILRDPSNPTVGALEKAPIVMEDSTYKDVSIELLNTSLNAGNNTISVQINNLKPVLIDSVIHHFIGTLDTVYLSYSVNGSAPVNQTWTGSLPIFGTDTFSFSIPYFVPKGNLYSIFIQAMLPASYIALALEDDSASYEIGSPMNGIYTVNGTNPDFSNLDRANYAVSVCHTSGPVTLNIRPSLDSLFSIYEYQEPNPITFQSETGNMNDVRIKIMDIYNSGRINFRNVTLHPRTDNDYLYNFKGAEFTGGPFSIDNCLIQGLNDPDYRNGITFVHTDSLSVTNCYFNNLENGITLSDYSLLGSDHFNGNNFIINNAFDTVTNCVRLLGYFAGDSIYVAKNIMNSPDLGVIYEPDGSGSKFIFEKNKIFGASTSALKAGTPFSFTVSGFYASNNMLGGTVQLNNFDNNSLRFDYNSVLGNLTITDSRNVHLHNNSIYSNSGLAALTFFQSLPGSTIYDGDFNNYYSPVANSLANISIYGGGTITAHSIGDITSVTGSESNSKSVIPYYQNAGDFHSISPVLNNAGTPLASVSTDIDDELRNVTSPDIGCDEYNYIDSLVWPGDCNYDGVANNYDLLSIGLYFNQSGSVRGGASNNWTGQPSANWGSMQYCGFDKKHTDCNGDGVINWGDTTAIKLNWGQIHAFKPALLPYILTLPDLHFVSSANSYAPGAAVDVEIWAGDASNVIPALYGISFDINYTSSLVQPGSMTLTYNPSWIGVENVTAVTTSNIGATAAGSIVRNTGTDTSGYGMFAKLHFVVDPAVATVTNFELSVSNYMALTSNGNLVQFNVVSDTLTIDPAAGIEANDPQASFTIYPNPATEEAVISYILSSASEMKIELYNSLGELVTTLKNEMQMAGIHQQKLSMPASKFPKGMYFVKLTAGGKISAKKLMLE